MSMRFFNQVVSPSLRGKGRFCDEQRLAPRRLGLWKPLETGAAAVRSG